jgi:hypothetical protein
VLLGFQFDHINQVCHFWERHVENSMIIIYFLRLMESVPIRVPVTFVPDEATLFTSRWRGPGASRWPPAAEILAPARRAR